MRFDGSCTPPSICVYSVDRNFENFCTFMYESRETLRRDTRASMRSNWREGRKKKKKKGRNWIFDGKFRWFHRGSIRSRVSLDEYPFTISPIFHSSITCLVRSIGLVFAYDDILDRENAIRFFFLFFLLLTFGVPLKKEERNRDKD